MLQIVQGRYFRDVPLTSKLHRGIYYTNLLFLREDKIDFVFGSILPSTNFNGLRSLTIEAKEQLEAVTLTGEREILVATSGDQLLDEIAAVIAFCLNVTCVRDYDMARRQIAASAGSNATRRGPASLLRQTFDADVIPAEESVKDLNQFLQTLIDLDRQSYEAALRAIRQIVAASLLVDEDAALAYTLMVAALESLGQTTEPKAATWLEYESTKRKRIDEATKEFDQAGRDKVRNAVLANEHLGLQRRFVAFVLDHVAPSFYRSEAVGAVRPIGATDLPPALRRAYAIRSRNVHALEGLSRELWMAGDRSDTAHIESGVVLNLEGLSRLSRHVVRRYVERGPKRVDKTFNYRSALPGIMTARLASQYWIWNANGFNVKTAPEYFSGMIEFLMQGIAKKEAGIVDMTEVLKLIERDALGFSKREDRLAMAGIMTLWNNTAPQELRRNLKRTLSTKFEKDLLEPSIISFAVAMVLGRQIEWSTEAVALLADTRRKERLGNKPTPMPTRIDAALHIILSDRLLRVGEREGAIEQLSHAVETVPGLADLMRFENAIISGENPVLNLDRFISGEIAFVEQHATNSEKSIAPPENGKKGSRRPVALSSDELDRARKLIRDGLSKTATARAIGVSPTTLRRYLTESDLQPKAPKA